MGTAKLDETRLNVVASRRGQGCTWARAFTSDRYASSLRARRATRGKRLAYLLLADLIFIVHLASVFVMFCGWLIPGVYVVYLGVLIAGAALQDLLGYCFLSVWEFAARQRAMPELDYGHSFMTHYVQKFVGRKLSDSLLARLTRVAVWTSIGANVVYLGSRAP